MTEETSRARDPERPRAVFSQEDFELIRTAIGNYLAEVTTDRERTKYSNLYHRLGRLT
ncbi:MAG: hypothetical protein KGI75_22910 [Rhizobiaceae bacterium]|nr:hypothetical protein [Rhizobiaceae bacterium]